MFAARSGGPLFVLFLLAQPAGALFVKPAVKQTLGSRHYAGTYAAVDVGSDDLRVRTSLNSYHSDDATGTYKTWAARASYDFEKYGLALSGGFSPRVNGYANRFVGGEGSISFDFEEGGADRPQELKQSEQKVEPSKRKFGLSRLDFTAGLTQIQHSDEFTATTNAQGRPVVKPSTSTIELAQTDLVAGVGLTITKTRLGIDLTKSVYNKDIAFIGARSAQVAFLSGVNSVVQGFPDISVSARLDVEAWEIFVPWVSYTYTRFKVAQPLSAAYALGLDGAWQDLSFSTSCQRYAQAGSADRNYVSAQVAFRFE